MRRNVALHLQLCNYLEDSSYYGDVAGAALIAAAIFRLAVLVPDLCEKCYIDFAKDRWVEVHAYIENRNGNVGPTPKCGTTVDRSPSLVGSSEEHCFVVICLRLIVIGKNGS